MHHKLHVATTLHPASKHDFRLENRIFVILLQFMRPLKIQHITFHPLEFRYEVFHLGRFPFLVAFFRFTFFLHVSFRVIYSNNKCYCVDALSLPVLYVEF